MKPLTIEQLKALKVGDWVWVVNTEKQESMYAKFSHCYNSFGRMAYCFETVGYTFHLFEEDYDTKWAAYKNKEYAEGKCVELLCRVGDTVYIPWVWNGESDVATLIVECIVMKDDGEDFWLCLDLETDDYKFVIKYRNHLMSDYGKTWFTDKSAAERRLAELTKE